MSYKDNLNDITNYLSDGKIILTPTDTIWGLSCDAHNEQAIDQIYQIKGRSFDKPLITLVSDIQMLKQYVPDIHPRIETLHHYHKRPLTIIYKDVVGLPAVLGSDFGTFAIRIVQEGICHDIIRQFGHAMTSTSANLSGMEYPKSFEDIHPMILDKADYIVFEGRKLQHLNEPSVVAIVNPEGELDILRP
jgi:L-threonylcarbamoyladenylate synthase